MTAPHVGERSHITGEGRDDFIVTCWQILERLVQKVLVTSERSQFLPSKILRTFFAETNVWTLITEGVDFFHEVTVVFTANSNSA